jgi:hypothetical protein
MPARLRRLGVLGNKHIPEAYLTAGSAQREALLQGLLDTDGTIHHRSGQVTFTGTVRALAEGVLFLSRSLGWRAGMAEGRAVLDGQDCGPKFTVTFTPKSGDPHRPFRMARKASRVGEGGRSSRFTVSVRSVELVVSRPVRCIQVGSPDGLYLAGRDLMPTHNTGVFKQAVLGWLYLTKERLVVWSAHEFRTSEEAFRDIETLLTGEHFFRREIKQIYRGNGDESIEMKYGGRLIFKARTKGGGRGLSGSKVILDEGYALQPMHMGALLPTLSAQPDPQVLYGSSAGHADSEVLRGVRDRGRAGGDPRLAYLEWCAAPPSEACQAGDDCTHAKTAVGCGCDDPRRWKQANPQAGGRISFDYIAAERRALPVSEFTRERMGWWDDPKEGVAKISPAHWETCKDEESTVLDPVSIGFAVAPDRSMSAIAIAGYREDGLVHVELVEYLPGTAWLADRVVDIGGSWHPCALAMNPAGPAGPFRQEMINRGFGPKKLKVELKTGTGEVYRPDAIPLMTTGAQDYAAGCGGFADAVTAHTIRHIAQQPLTDAAEGARTRDLGDAWAWSHKNSKADITPVEAVTLARMGLLAYGSAPEPPDPFFLLG